ncbi:fimbrial biogenesis chaperone [Candidatus Erwinia dacicola]|uniref:Pili assembly chaperone N-terminal domain-containing protein n=3 Tax=Candidatus Erwinia dacicola TaxID=252393 RepID=A0A1E7Z356_9GAMM|nr:hypothetical protein BBW68_06210 [Candidatus Erwinia dacicola]
MKKLAFLLIFLSLGDYATAGVMPSRSRVVYSEGSREQSLMLANTNAYPVIVQTWIDNGEGTPDAKSIPFVSVPPVLRFEPQGIKGVRIIYNHTMLPSNRESLFWFNIYEIPPENKDDTRENNVLVTMNTQIKLFYRPAEVHITPEEAMPKVTCLRTDTRMLQCHNPSPIHLSVIGAKIHYVSGSIGVLNTDLLMKPLASNTLNFIRDIPDVFSVELRYVNDTGEQTTYTLKTDK